MKQLERLEQSAAVEQLERIFVLGNLRLTARQLNYSLIAY
jgi:hypothetical protein